jgi:hypothetical protein
VEKKLKESMSVEVLDLSANPNSKKELNSAFKMYSSYESAKAIFRASLKEYKQSEKVYTLEEHATEHIELQKDLVQLYSHCLLMESGRNNNTLT